MKTTHLALADRERALAWMRANQQQISLTEHISRLIRQDGAGLSEYLDGASAAVEVDHDR